MLPSARGHDQILSLSKVWIGRAFLWSQLIWVPCNESWIIPFSWDWNVNLFFCLLLDTLSMPPSTAHHEQSFLNLRESSKTWQQQSTCIIYAAVLCFMESSQSCLLILGCKYNPWSLQPSFVSPSVNIVINKHPKALLHLAFWQGKECCHVVTPTTDWEKKKKTEG